VLRKFKRGNGWKLEPKSSSNGIHLKDRIDSKGGKKRKERDEKILETY